MPFPKTTPSTRTPTSRYRYVIHRSAFMKTCTSKGLRVLIPWQGKNSKKYYRHIFERNSITENQGCELSITENETGQSETGGYQGLLRGFEPGHLL